MILSSIVKSVFGTAGRGFESLWVRLMNLGYIQVL